jgi:hypothetical protein
LSCGSAEEFAKSLGDADDLSGYKAAHPRFVIPTPNGGGILFVHSLRLSSNTSCTQSSSASQIPPPRSASE